MTQKLLTPTLIFAICFVLCSSAKANTPSVSSSNRWWTYIADYDGKPGSTRVDLAARDVAPLITLPTLVVFGVKYEQKLETGFPTEDALEKLNAESDSLIAAVLSAQPSVYVGTFTHAGEQIHYIYAKSPDGTEAAFLEALRKKCPSCTPVYRTRSDPAWNAYLTFLYPNKATLDHYGLDVQRLRSSR